MNLTITEGNLHIELAFKEQLAAARLHKLWEIPLSHIQQVTATAPKTTWKELRAPGTFIPGWLKFGTYYTERGKEFWLVNYRQNNYLTIELQKESYQRIVLTIENNEFWQQKISEKIKIS